MILTKEPIRTNKGGSLNADINNLDRSDHLSMYALVRFIAYVLFNRRHYTFQVVGKRSKYLWH